MVLKKEVINRGYRVVFWRVRLEILFIKFLFFDSVIMLIIFLGFYYKIIFL